MNSKQGPDNPMIKAVIETVAKHYSYPEREVKIVYETLYSIDKTILVLEMSSMFNVSPLSLYHDFYLLFAHGQDFRK